MSTPRGVEHFDAPEPAGSTVIRVEVILTETAAVVKSSLDVAVASGTLESYLDAEGLDLSDGRIKGYRVYDGDELIATSGYQWADVPQE